MKIFWKTAVSDNFATAADWNPGQVPGPSDMAMMTVAGTCTVTANANVTVLGLSTGIHTTLDITNSSTFAATEGTAIGASRGTVSIEDGSTLQIGGTFNNIGTINLNGSSQRTQIAIQADTILKGGGTIVATDFGGLFTGNYIQGNAGGITNVDDTISGAISINATLNNEMQGVIDATAASNPLNLVGRVTNAGLLEGTGAAGLALGSNFAGQANITNTSTGIIKAGAGSKVTINGGTITGGTLETVGNGIVNVNGLATFDGSNAVVPTNTMITNAGHVAAANGTFFVWEGTIKNTGEIDLNASTSLTRIEMAGSSAHVTLSGGGRIVFSDSSNNEVISDQNQPATLIALTNTDNKISGAGRIGDGHLQLTNKVGGLIDATGTNPLIIDTGANTVVNAGVLQADASSELFIASDVSNTGTLNANSGDVVVEGAVTGGHAVINGTGQIEFGAASNTATKFAAGSTGELIFDASGPFTTGTISGFAANTTQSIDLANVQFASASKSYMPGSPNTSGTLTVKDTAGDTAHLKFSGSYTLANFHFADDGNGGTLITKASAFATAQSMTNSGDVTLLGNYMASSFATAATGSHGGMPMPNESTQQPLIAPAHA